MRAKIWENLIGLFIASPALLWIFLVAWSVYREHIIFGMNHGEQWEDAVVVKKYIPAYINSFGLGHGPIVSRPIPARYEMTLLMHDGRLTLEFGSFYLEKYGNFVNGQKVRIKHRGSLIISLEQI